MEDKTSHKTQFIIYLAKNIQNGKSYVGLTRTTLKKRIDHHMCSMCRGTFQRRCYGRDGFTFSVLELVDTKEQACQRESFWIIKIGSKHPNGYNLTDGGEGVVGVCKESLRRMAEKKRGSKASEETKRKMSLSHRGKTIWSPEQREAIRQRTLGLRRSAEARKRIGDVQRGKPKGPRPQEVKDKIAAGLRGKRLSQEHKNKISLTLMGNIPWSAGKTFSADHIRHLSESHRGKVQSDETKKKQSDSLKAAHARIGKHWIKHWVKTPEQKCRESERASIAMKKWQASRTPEQRHAYSMLGLAARRANRFGRVLVRQES